MHQWNRTEKDAEKLLKSLMNIVLETANATRGVLVLEDSTTKEWSVELGGSLEKDHDSADNSEDDQGNAVVAASPVLTASDATLASSSSDGATVDTDAITPIRRSRGGSVRHAPRQQNASDPTSSPDSAFSDSSSCSPTIRPVAISAVNTTPPPIRIRDLSVADALPSSIFNYIRTQRSDTVLLTDLTLDSYELFSEDSYFESHSPKAVLCIPVLRAVTSKVFGVLYLENDTNRDAFNGAHIQLLQLLVGQAALSIDNAKLYSQLENNNADLEELVKQRTSELEIKNSQLQSAKDEAEKATKAKADFLSNMSHEIRTPMNAVLGVARLLADTQLSLEQQQYVTMITNSGHLLLTIINDILDYSKIEAGELKLNYSSQNIVDCIETAMILVYEMASSKGLNISWFIDPNLPSSLMIDGTRLQQIVLNLLSNAIKFTKTGGVDLTVTGKLLPPSAATPPMGSAHHSKSPSTLSSPHLPSRSLSPAGLRTPPHQNSPKPKRRQLEQSPPQSVVQSARTISRAPSPSSPPPQRYQLEISCTDSGIGISKAQLSTLFKSFSQVQHSSSEYGGTGLGLVISARLVAAMGGSEISVDSTVGVGSTFRFSIVASVPPTLDTDSPRLTERTIPLPPSSNLSSPIHAPRRHNAPASPAKSFVAPSPSPLIASRRLVNSMSHASTAVGTPIVAPSPHGLTTIDRTVLERRRVIYVGANNASSVGWVKIFQHYGMNVQVTTTIPQAIKLLQERQMELLSPSPRSPEANPPKPSIPPTPPSASLPSPCTPSLSPTSPSTSLCDLLIVDLDTPECSEEFLLEQLQPFPSVRVLLLYSKTVHGLPALVSTSSTYRPSMSNSAPITPFTPVVTLLASPSVTSPPNFGSSSSSTSRTMTAVTMPSPLLPHHLRSTSSSSVASAPPVPFVPDYEAALMNPQPQSTIFTPSVDSRIITDHVQPLAPTTRIPSRIRKPFKLRALMRAIIHALTDTAPSNSTSPNHPSSVLMQDGDHAYSSATAHLGGNSSGSISSPHTPQTDLLFQQQQQLQHQQQQQSLIGGGIPKPKIVKISHKYPLRVLLAEDNVVNQKLMSMTMRKLGYEILIAAHGAEVLEILEREAKKGRSHEIECILMDASMDVMDGMEATRVIRSQQLPNRIRPFIIAQTANVTEEYRNKCLESGMDMFSVKPIHIEELVKCLRTAYTIHQKAYAAAAAEAAEATATATPGSTTSTSSASTATPSSIGTPTSTASTLSESPSLSSLSSSHSSLSDR